jgi:hypothetical protein
MYIYLLDLLSKKKYLSSSLSTTLPLIYSYLELYISIFLPLILKKALIVNFMLTFFFFFFFFFFLQVVSVLFISIIT